MHRNILMLVTGLLLSGQLPALQVKFAMDDQTISGKISSRELSRIFVKDDRIQAARGVSGEYELMKDEREGMIFIRPATYTSGRPFNLFVTTVQGHTWNLLLVPSDIPAESIQIVPLSPSRDQVQRERNASFTELLVHLITDMANGRQPDDPAAIPVVDRSIHFPDLDMQLISVFRGNGLQGEIWCIRNLSKEIQHLDPAQFFQEGVRAIACETETLLAGEETRLYRVISHE